MSAPCLWKVVSLIDGRTIVTAQLSEAAAQTKLKEYVEKNNMFNYAPVKVPRVKGVLPPYITLTEDRVENYRVVGYSPSPPK